MVMQGRQIQRCLDSYEALPIDKMYFKGFCEKQLEKPITDFIEQTNYQHYIITSDDQVISRQALALIQEGLKKHDVVTGYCTLPDDSTKVNLCKLPLEDPIPRRSSYDWMRLSYVNSFPDEYIPTTFAGFFLTGMSRQLWRRFPFRCYGILPESLVTPWLVRRLHDYGLVSQSIKGFSSDYNLCRRLASNGIRIHAAKGAIIEHLGGSSWGAHLPLIVGKVKSSIRLAPYV